MKVKHSCWEGEKSRGMDIGTVKTDPRISDIDLFRYRESHLKIKLEILRKILTKAKRGTKRKSQSKKRQISSSGTI